MWGEVPEHDDEIALKALAEVVRSDRAQLEAAREAFANLPEIVAKRETYDMLATNLRPDHLAILLGEAGACSVEDGCGVFAMNQSGEESFGMFNTPSLFEPCEPARSDLIGPLPEFEEPRVTGLSPFGLPDEYIPDKKSKTKTQTLLIEEGSMSTPNAIRVNKVCSVSIEATVDGRLDVTIQGKHHRSQHATQEAALAAGEKVYQEYISRQWSLGKPHRGGLWVCPLK